MCADSGHICHARCHAFCEWNNSSNLKHSTRRGQSTQKRKCCRMNVRACVVYASCKDSRTGARRLPLAWTRRSYSVQALWRNIVVLGGFTHFCSSKRNISLFTLRPGDTLCLQSGRRKGAKPCALLRPLHSLDLRSYHVSQSMLSLFSAFLVVYMIRHSYSMCESYLGTCTIFANYIHHDEVGRHRSAHAIRQPAVLISSNCWARAVKILQCIDYDPPACSRRDLLAWTRHSNFLRAISEQLTHRVCLMMFSTDIHWNNVTGSRLLSCPTIEDEHFTWVLWETRS